MSLLSGIGKMFKSLMAALKKLLKWLIPILIIALIIIAIWFPYLLPVIWGWVTTAWTAVGGWITTAFKALAGGLSTIWTAATEWVGEASFADVLKLATGAAIILNPEGVADAAGSVIETVIDGASKILGPYLPFAIGGALLWLFWPDSKDKEREVTVRVDQPREPLSAVQQEAGDLFA